MTDLPARARVVVVGGGVIGCSTAYHLVKLGWSDVLVLEQGHLSGGTTWALCGNCGSFETQPHTGATAAKRSGCR